MNTPTTCPQCGTELPANTVRGLCPKCLALVAMESGSEDKTMILQRPAEGTVHPALNPTLHYFGDYELLEEIARGGMGVVYKARQVSLNRVVAVKMILGGQLATEADVKRFRTEAEAAANLQHPNIVAIHEIGEHEGRHYFSMDLIDGTDLANLTRNGPILVAKAAQYVKTIAEAIHYAHQQGTLHRDLKPHNVLIDRHDQPRITDFGLAKLTKTNSSITQEGTVMGSPSYMPPEQAAGRHAQVGSQSDVYSIGAVLYHLLTGQAPFAGATAIDTLRQVLDEDPVPPSRLNPKVPADLETICLKCMAKQPEQRYATAGELAEDLAHFLNFEPIRAKSASGLRRVWSWAQKNPWVFVGALASLVLMFAGAAYGLFERMRFLGAGSHLAPDALASPSLLILKALPVLALLLYFGFKSFRQKYGSASMGKTVMRPAALLVYSGVGVLAIVASIAGFILQIKAWAWKVAPMALLPLEMFACLCAAAISWLGFHLVWQAVGVHHSSRFRSLVEQSVEKELQYESRRWSARKLVFFALWLCGAVGWLCFLVLAAISIKLAPRLTVEDSTLGPGLAVVLACSAVVVFVAWAVRMRRRLLTNVFAPLALTLFGGYLGFLFVHPSLLPTCASLLVSGVLLSLAGLGFLPPRTSSDGVRVRFPGRPWLDAAAGVALLIGLFFMLHVIENDRGRRTWERVQAELAAKGESLDFTAFAKVEPVPDDENVMAHPFMAKFFIRGDDHLSILHPPHEWKTGSNAPYAVTILAELPRSVASDSLVELIGDRAGHELIPLLQFTNEPLDKVIGELAKRAGIAVAALPKELPNGPATLNVSNRTAVQALDQIRQQWMLEPDVERWRKEGVLAFQNQPAVSLQGLLDWYDQYGDELRQIEEALQRPHSQISANLLRPEASPTPNFESYRVTAQAYVNLANIHLLMGDADAALKHLRLLRRFIDIEVASHPPTLVEAIVKTRLAEMLAETLQQTLREGLWPSSHYQRLQILCSDIALVPELSLAMRGERAGILRLMNTALTQHKGRFFDQLEGVFLNPDEDATWTDKVVFRLTELVVPYGWVDQNFATFALQMQETIQTVDATQQQINPALMEAAHQRLLNGMMAKETGKSFRPYHLLADIGIPNLLNPTRAIAEAQTRIDMAAIGLALERYRAIHGGYPQKLESLAPEFVTRLPHDVVNGQPLRYRLTENDEYLLYSVGWNLKDDGGEPDHILKIPERPLKSDAKSGAAQSMLGRSHGKKRTVTRAERDWPWQGVPKKLMEAKNSL